MRQVTYTQRLHGRVTTVGPGLADVELAGAGATPLGDGARLLSQLEFADRRSFRAKGTIELGAAAALRVSSLGDGDLAPAPAPGLRHGTAVLEVEGLGRLAGVTGRITSNFLVTAGGDVTDEQVVLLFIDGEEK